MIVSMTGYGTGRYETELISVSVQLRSVNHRHLKVQVRGSEPYATMEAEFEKLIRKRIKRGSLLLEVHVQRSRATAKKAINREQLTALISELQSICEANQEHNLLPHLLPGLLTVPGMIENSIIVESLHEGEWPSIERATEAALESLQTARINEGKATAEELRQKYEMIVQALNTAKVFLPKALDDYRTRLLERMRQAACQLGTTIQEEHLLRELALFADRTDVNEEVHRLEGHLEEFAKLVEQGSDDSTGKRLEFLVQEMGREINTLGSKAADVAVSRCVFDMKIAAEQIREMVQNIE